jgi:hypothetical protein
MRVTLEIPHHIAADLQRVMRRSYGDLPLPQTIATCIAYSLASSSKAKHPDANRDFADLALKLIAMQPRSHD